MTEIISQKRLKEVLYNKAAIQYFGDFARLNILDMSDFAVYTLDNCIPCQQAKEKLKASNTEYDEYVIGKDISRDEVKLKFPYARLTPVIVHLKSGSIIPLSTLDLMIVANKMMNSGDENES